MSVESWSLPRRLLLVDVGVGVVGVVRMVVVYELLLVLELRASNDGGGRNPVPSLNTWSTQRVRRTIREWCISRQRLYYTRKLTQSFACAYHLQLYHQI